MEKIEQYEISKVLEGFSRMTGIGVHLVNSKKHSGNNENNIALVDYCDVEISTGKSYGINFVSTGYGINYGIISCYNEQWVVGPIVIPEKDFEGTAHIKSQERTLYEQMKELPEMSLINFEYHLLVLFSSLTKMDVKDIDYAYSMQRQPLSTKGLSENTEEGRLDVCMEYIKNNLEESLSLKSIADYCGYNPTYLSRKFKKVYGINLNKFILEMRLNVAANYLENSNKTLSEISEDLNFSSQSHFQNTFKMVYRITPMAYRKSKKQEIHNGNKLEV